tara:strand:+ start:79 stop:1140 length:1062 start_codon:yes stop_codon:yes gene_type:complete
MENAEAQTTLRDTLEASFDSVVEPVEPRPSTIVAAPTADETAVREQRIRDEAGRFAKDAPVQKAATPATPSTVATTETPSPVVAAPVRPQSWKKDYWQDYDKIALENPKLADYISQREKEYQTGVSAYKSEAENARQINEAIAPFLPNLQKHGMEPTQWIRSLGMAHEQLALGSPQQKVQTFAALLNQYGVDPQYLFQVLSGQAPQIPQQAMQSQPQDIERIVEAKLTQKEVNNEYQRFITEAPEKYPHFEAVKETMAGLLQAELAQDYKSAYEAAIRHPRHADIWDAQQTAQREADAAAQREKSQATVRSAKARTVSTPSATPGAATAKPNGRMGLRDGLSEAFDSVISSRV